MADDDEQPVSAGADAVVVGAGPAGLMAAERLALAGMRVRIYDRMPSPARKFLMAGRGGLNLTHSEPFDAFMERYGPAADRLRTSIERMSPPDLRAWATGLGEETFVGSSGRVFPRSFKASPLLRAWTARLSGLGVELHSRHEWRGWADRGTMIFGTPGGEIEIAAGAVTILALGGASWPRLGSDGGWVGPLRDGTGAEIVPLRAANAGVEIAWSDRFAGHAGAPLKRIAVALEERCVRGEAVITQAGLEGGAIYALSREIRQALDRAGGADIMIDLRPDVEEEALAARLSRPRGKQSVSTFLRKAAGLSPAAIAVLREAGALPVQPAALAAHIKAARLQIVGMQGLERAISSSGGVMLGEIDERFMLRRRPGIFLAGEMLDWEAPTGGYLLQACFATGSGAAAGAVSWLAEVRSGQDVARRDMIS